MENRVDGYARVASLLMMVVVALALVAAYVVGNRALANRLDALTEPPVLRLRLTPSRTVAKIDDVITYTLVLDGATGTTEVDAELPVQLDYVGGSASDGATYDPASRTVQWKGIPPSGRSVPLTFQARTRTLSADYVEVWAWANDSSGVTTMARAKQLLNAYENNLPVRKQILSTVESKAPPGSTT